MRAARKFYSGHLDPFHGGRRVLEFDGSSLALSRRRRKVSPWRQLHYSCSQLHITLRLGKDGRRFCQRHLLAPAWASLKSSSHGFELETRSVASASGSALATVAVVSQSVVHIKHICAPLKHNYYKKKKKIRYSRDCVVF